MTFKRKSLWHSIRLTVMALALLTLPTVPTVLASTPIASPEAAGRGPVIDAYQDDLTRDEDTFPRYSLDLALDPAQSTLSGTLMLTYPNTTGETLTELPLRLYPNADYYLEGETSISSIEIDGQSIAPRFDASGTVLFLDLPTALAPGEVVTATMGFTTVIPRNSDGSYGILNHDVAGERFVLADWYPVVAGRDETGWRLEPPTYHGDPTFSTTSLFDLHLRVPDGSAVIATGTETVLDDGVVQIESGPVREFAMIVDSGLTEISARVEGTDVSVYVASGNEANGQHTLDLAADGLSFYNQMLGPYPYTELDFVQVPLALAYGVSWAGILFINEGQLALPAENRTTLDFTILHELGHQWWGALVGANSNDHTWMVEGLTNATAVLAQAEIQGPEAAIGSLDAWIVGPYLNLLGGSGDGVADVSIFDQSAGAPLSTLAYGKGALGFLAIRNAIGHDAFTEALGNYAETFRLEIADPADLRAAFESASGRDLGELWTFWFESAQTTWADVDQLVAEIVASL